MLQGRARVVQVLDVGRARPVAQVRQVCDKGGIVEELLRREVIEVGWVREGLDELE